MTDYFTDTEEGLDGPSPFVAGERFAPGDQVIAHMSRGNNLDVYDAWSEERACRVIAKTPRPDRLEDRRTVRALMREGRLLKKFTHPHIVRAYEVSKEPQPVVFLETLTGATLAYLIDTSSRRLAISEIVHLGLHLCSALHYLHRQGVLHLDLKPSNIISEGRLQRRSSTSASRGPRAGRKRRTGPDEVHGPRAGHR